jgi:hypothetical protein
MTVTDMILSDQIWHPERFIDPPLGLSFGDLLVHCADWCRRAIDRWQITMGRMMAACQNGET